MKLLIAILPFCLFLQVIGRIPYIGFEDLSELCLWQTGKDLNSVSVMEDMGQFNENDKELFGCIYNYARVVSTSNKVDKDGLFNFVFTLLDMPGPEGIKLAKDMADICQDYIGDDYQMTALKIQNCVNEYMNTLIWFTRNTK